MSLAEPKRRKKWTLNPRGTLWANDDTKFGQKLMEKMGWTKGSGLGREQQGMKEHLAVSFKDDNKGIGYKGSDDEWIKHYEGFENVLASLNSQENMTVNSKGDSGNNSDGPPDHDSIGKTSLESSSKSSRSRVHYHKFTRGKDLSRCTKDDLGCILGSKRAKQLAKEKAVEETVCPIDEVGHVDHSMGVTTIKGCSMQDYFAQKMEALRNRPKSQPETVAEENRGSSEEENMRMPGLGVSCGDGEGTLDSPDYGEESREGKKKKKKKKHQVGTEETVSAGTESCVEAEMDIVPKKKKKKKRPESNGLNAINGTVCEDSTIEAASTNGDNVQTNNCEKERKKTKKRHSEAAAEEHSVSEELPAVKKKKKRKHTNAVNEDNSSQHLTAESEPEKKKKKKKCKAVD